MSECERNCKNKGYLCQECHAIFNDCFAEVVEAIDQMDREIEFGKKIGIKCVDGSRIQPLIREAKHVINSMVVMKDEEESTMYVDVFKKQSVDVKTVYVIRGIRDEVFKKTVVAEKVVEDDPDIETIAQFLVDNPKADFAVVEETYKIIK